MKTRLPRKRLRNPSKWRRNTIKESRYCGEEYNNCKGNIHPKRHIKPTCTNCRQKCGEKLSEERIQIFENYWHLRDLKQTT